MSITCFSSPTTIYFGTLRPAGHLTKPRLPDLVVASRPPEAAQPALGAARREGW